MADKGLIQGVSGYLGPNDIQIPGYTWMPTNRTTLSSSGQSESSLIQKPGYTWVSTNRTAIREPLVATSSTAGSPAGQQYWG